MTASLLPEGCLLCCPALLKSWRAGARCCCVHWRLPSAAFPAHRSFVCQREGERGRRGRSEIMVVNVLKKNMWRATMHRTWMKGWRDWNLFIWIKQFAESFSNTNGSFDQRSVSAFPLKHPCRSSSYWRSKKKKKKPSTGNICPTLFVVYLKQNPVQRRDLFLPFTAKIQ